MPLSCMKYEARKDNGVRMHVASLPEKLKIYKCLITLSVIQHLRVHQMMIITPQVMNHTQIMRNLIQSETMDSRLTSLNHAGKGMM